MIVNLGDKSKVVTYGSNGLTNCLDLCKCILKKYGLTNFGSPNNIFRLIYEDNGTIKYYEIYTLSTSLDYFQHRFSKYLPIKIIS